MLRTAGCQAIRKLVLVTSILSFGCGTPPRTDDRDVGTRFREMSGDVRVRLTTESSMVENVIPAEWADVWAALIEVYDELEVPLATYDLETLEIGNPEFQPSRIGGQRLSRFLDCGAAVTGRPYADRYRVTMHLITSVQAEAPDRSRIRTEIDATAMPRDMSGYPIHCISNGALERRITEAVLEKTG